MAKFLSYEPNRFDWHDGKTGSVLSSALGRGWVQRVFYGGGGAFMVDFGQGRSKMFTFDRDVRGPDGDLESLAFRAFSGEEIVVTIDD